MRLLSNVPIRRIHDVLGMYHRNYFGQVKQFIALGEKLKVAEQKLVKSISSTDEAVVTAKRLVFIALFTV